MRPHRRQPSRLPRPWDSPGKNTGVGCHFLLQCMKVKSESEIPQSCPTLSDPMDCSLPGSSAHGIFQARVLEWGAIAFSVTDTNWFQIGKGVRQGCILSTCLFNLYTEYIRRNAGLEEAQAGIKIAGRNINNLSYADDTTLTAETEEELNSLLIKVKEESEKAGLKLNIQKTNIMAASPITSWQIYGETVTDFIFLGSKITADGDCSHEIKRLFPSYLTYIQTTS